MARENRVRLSDAELERVRNVRDEWYSDEVADDIPLGAVIGDVMTEELKRQGAIADD